MTNHSESIDNTFPVLLHNMSGNMSGRPGQQTDEFTLQHPLDITQQVEVQSHALNDLLQISTGHYAVI